MNRTAPKRIGLIGYEGITALDLVGPAEVFASATVGAAGGPGYEVVVLGAARRSFRAESGVAFTADRLLRDAPALDTLIVPGGRGLREPATNRVVREWIARRAPSVRRIASVCTGIYGLAPTGLLDGRRVTTHWKFARDVARKFPALRVEADAIYIREGKFYTAAGITAGLDLALALVEEDYGPGVALAVARELVMYVKREGGQEQFSAPLQFQMQAKDRFGELMGWIVTHLEADLSVEALATRAALCPRHFARLFKASFGQTPAALVEQRRLDEARQRLVATTVPVEEIGRSVGFPQPDTFRRAFERQFGVTPGCYRQRFRRAS